MSQIEADRVVLREIRRDDVSHLHRWLTDPESAHLLSMRNHPQTVRETERFVEAQISGADPLNRAFIIGLRDREIPAIGTTGCYNIDWRNRSGELGIVIGEKTYRERGYGAEALELVLKFGFHKLDMHRLYVRVFDFNQHAIRTYRKCGMAEEGRLREAHYREGRYHDIVIMSILEDEYLSGRQSSVAGHQQASNDSIDDR
jgi:RimJ/RimL family protein N-acetyltransferase